VDNLEKVETQTMTSPSPTQPPPTQTPILIPEQKVTIMAERKPAENKPARATPLKRRLGDTRTARITKAILRPPFKLLYYLSSWIKHHKLASLSILLLLAISISATSYYLTDEFPFGIDHDSFNFPYNGGKGEGGLVEAWLYALKDGDVTKLSVLEQNIPQGQTTDPSQLVSQFSQAKAHLTWGEATVIAVHQQSDSTIDSFVQVPLSTNTPGTSLKGILLLHFVTASVNGQDALLGVDVIPLRPLQS
jgi:hypothetical protein